MTLTKEQIQEIVKEGVKGQFDESFKAKLSTFGENIDSRLAEKGLDAEQLDILKQAAGIYTELQDRVNKADERFEKMEGMLKAAAAGGASTKGKSFEQILEATLKGDHSDLLNKSGSFGKEMAFKDITEGTNLVNDVILADRLNNVIFDPERRVRVRQLIPGGTMSSDRVSYPKETAYTDNTEMVGEGTAPSAQISFTLTQTDTYAKKIAGFLKISNEAMEDLSFIVSYLSVRLPAKLLNLEDTQLLFGSGVGDNIEGITTVAQAFASNLVVSSPQKIDVLRAAVAQCRVDEYMATAIFLNPEDAADLELQKGNDGHYVLPVTMLMADGQKRIASVPVVEHTAMTQGSFLVGDFTLGCQLFDRRQMSIRFSDVDENNLQTDQTTVYISERIALALYRDTAFVFDTFANGITDLTA